MIGHALLYGTALTCVIVSGTIFSPSRLDPSSLDLYKTDSRNNEFDYGPAKRNSRDAQESPDSKERRSQIGSSFVRFGRGRAEANLENGDYTGNGGGGGELDTASRIARAGRPDIIIRFGRSDSKNIRGSRLSRSELKFIRNGKEPLEMNDLDRLSVACSNALAGFESNENRLGLRYPKFLRLCGFLGLGTEENDEIRRGSKIIEFLDDPSQTKSIERE